MGAGFSAFGKIPAVGDFFRLGDGAAFVPVWDRWVQSAMLAGQTALGSAWDDHYMSAPIWRFSLSAGLAGGAGAIGVLMPSVDRVGRRFPLTLYCASPSPVEAHFSAPALFERLESLALRCLDDDMTRDMLDRALAEIPPPPAGTGPVATGTRALVAPSPDGLCAGLAAAFVTERANHPSIWSAALPEDGSRLMICAGLPTVQESVPLFNLDAPMWREAGA